MTEETKQEVKKESAAKPSWLKTKPAELQKLVLDMHKKGMTPAQIGLELRDKHGIPKAKVLGKKITEIIEESGSVVDNDTVLIEKKVETLKSHLGKNKHDYSAQRSLTKKLWAVHNAKA
jgi:ribosomal protein S15P/S13E